MGLWLASYWCTVGFLLVYSWFTMGLRRHPNINRTARPRPRRTRPAPQQFQGLGLVAAQQDLRRQQIAVRPQPLVLGGHTLDTEKVRPLP